MHAYPNFWPMADRLLNWGFKANGKVDPIGTLVAPLPPASAKQAPSRPRRPGRRTPRAGQVRRHAIGISSRTIEIAAAAVVVLAIICLVAVRRRRRRCRRYRPRLKLPPI